MMHKWYVLQTDIHIESCVFYDITQTPTGTYLLDFDVQEGENPLFAAATAIAKANLDTTGLHIRYTA